jgi:hypothetical protein
MDVVRSGMVHEKAAIQIHPQRHSNDCFFLAPGNIHGLYRSVKNQTVISQLKSKTKNQKSNQHGYYHDNRLCTMLHSRILDIL